MDRAPAAATPAECNIQSPSSNADDCETGPSRPVNGRPNGRQLQRAGSLSQDRPTSSLSLPVAVPNVHYVPGRPTGGFLLVGCRRQTSRLCVSLATRRVVGQHVNIHRAP